MASHLTPSSGHWLEISAPALRHNLSYIQKIAPRSGIIAMVKANAYGHGFKQIAPLLAPKVKYFGVNTFAEATTIRKLGLATKILITAPINPSLIATATRQNFSLSVHSLDYLRKVIGTNSPPKIHLKVNTGMNRLGLSMVELLTALNYLHCASLIPEGIYTHFHSADINPTATLAQFDQFQQAIFQTKYLFPSTQTHCANTDAILKFPQTRLDLIRPGGGLYGLNPDPNFRPVLSWYAKAVQTRQLSAGQTVGYQATYTASKVLTTAILPVGYSDGYPRLLGNRSRVYSGSVSCPVIGNVSMNFLTVDISRARTRPSVLELIGHHISARRLATLAGTIDYEIVSRLSPGISRIIKL